MGLKLGTYSETSFELLTPGERRLELVKIDQKDTSPEYIQLNDQGEVKNPFRWEWTWAVVKGGNLGAQFKTWTNATIAEGSTAGPIVAALLGRPLQIGEQPDVEDITGKQMDCYIANKHPKSTKDGNYIMDPRPVGQTALPGVLSPAAQAAESGSSAALFSPQDDLAREALGFPRRFIQAKGGLLEKGITKEGFEACCVRVVGNDKPFKDQGVDTQKVLIEHLESWVQYPEAYDEEGGVSF